MRTAHTELNLIGLHQLYYLPIPIAATKPNQGLKILSDSLGKKLYPVPWEG
jgi:hypothetical protein